MASDVRGAAAMFDRALHQPKGIRMFTEDNHRRRELAAAGVTAEVEGDGHTIRVTLDQPQFDQLVVGYLTDEALSETRRADYDAGHEAGQDEGYEQGHRSALEAIAALKAAS